MITNINLHQLRAFYLAVKHGSVTRAADLLSVSQPAVSMQIKAMEKKIGIKLFRKHGKDLELTQPGLLVFGYAEKIFPVVEDMEFALKSHLELSQDALTIGTTRSFAKYLMPGLVSRFQEDYPQVKISLGEGSSREIAEAVLSYKYDLGIIGSMPLQGRLKVIPFSKETFCLVVSPQHRFESGVPVNLSELENEPVIIREEGSGSRHMLLSYFEAKGIKPSVLIETSSVEFIKEYVMKGRGVSFLYEPEAQFEAGNVLLKTIEIREGPIVLNTDIVLPADVEPSPVAGAFLRLILRDAKKRKRMRSPG